MTETDNPRYKAELLEDEGINPETKAMQDEPMPQPTPVSNPVELIVGALTAAKIAIDAGKTLEAQEKLKFVRTMIAMGINIADSRGLIALKNALEAYRKQADELEERLLKVS